MDRSGQACDNARRMSELDSKLVQLERQDLVRAARDTDPAYWFKHALVQGSVYETLLKHDRRRVHRTVAETLERLYPERLDALAGLLAQHFSEAGDAARTVEYAARAGDAAARVYAYPEARVQYARALDALGHWPESADRRRREVDLLVRLVTVAWTADPQEENLARLKHAEEILQQDDAQAKGERSVQDRLRLARVHYSLARLYLIRNASGEAIRYARLVLDEAGDLGDLELVAIPLSFMGQALVVQGHFDEAEPVLARAIPLLAQTAFELEWIRTVGFHGIALAGLGRYADGVAEAERALARAREAHSASGQTILRVYLAFIYSLGGDLQRMKAASAEVIAAAEQAGDRLLAYLGWGFQAWAETRLGDHAAAQASMARANGIAQDFGGRLVLENVFAAVAAEIALNAGRRDEALALADKTIAQAGETGGIFAQGLAQRVRGQALVRLDPPQFEQAEAELAHSLENLLAGGAVLEAARTQLVWAELERARGNAAGAREHLADALARFEAAGVDVAAERARAQRAEPG